MPVAIHPPARCQQALWQASALCPPSGPFSAAPCQGLHLLRPLWGSQQAVWGESQRGGAQACGPRAALWALAGQNLLQSSVPVGRGRRVCVLHPCGHRDGVT